MRRRPGAPYQPAPIVGFRLAVSDNGGWHRCRGIEPGRCLGWTAVDPTAPVAGRKRRRGPMRPWTRLQDYGALVAGVYAALSPIWVSTTGERGAFWALIVLGVLIAATALFSLAVPGMVATEWLTVVFGVLLFVAPWVLTYTDRMGASWTSW